MVDYRIFLRPIASIAIYCALSQCNKNKNSSKREQGPDLHSDQRSRRPLHSEKESDDNRVEIIKRIRDRSKPLQPSEISQLRKDFEQYLLGSVSQEQAISSWLNECLKSISTGDRDQVAAALLFSVNDLAYVAGGNYIERNFISSDNRLRTLVSWFSFGIERKDTGIFSILANVKDPRDRLIYAEFIGGSSAIRLGSDEQGLDWLVANAPSELLPSFFSGYLDSAPRPPSEEQLIRTINNHSISDESRLKLISYYSKSIAAVDPSRAIDFLVSNQIGDQSAWKSTIENISTVESTIVADIYSKIPDSMIEEKNHLQVIAVKSQGVESVMPFFTSGGKATPQLASAIAVSLVTKGNFEHDLSVISQIPDQSSKKMILENSVMQGVLNGLGDKRLEALSRELNDQAAYDLSLRQAASILNKANRDKGAGM